MMQFVVRSHETSCEAVAKDRFGEFIKVAITIGQEPQTLDNEVDKIMLLHFSTPMFQKAGIFSGVALSFRDVTVF